MVKVDKVVKVVKVVEAVKAVKVTAAAAAATAIRSRVNARWRPKVNKERAIRWRFLQ